MPNVMEPIKNQLKRMMVYIMVFGVRLLIYLRVMRRTTKRGKRQRIRELNPGPIRI